MSPDWFLRKPLSLRSSMELVGGITSVIVPVSCVDPRVDSKIVVSNSLLFMVFSCIDYNISWGSIPPLRLRSARSLSNAFL